MTTRRTQDEDEHADKPADAGHHEGEAGEIVDSGSDSGDGGMHSGGGGHDAPAVLKPVNQAAHLAIDGLEHTARAAHTTLEVASNLAGEAAEAPVRVGRKTVQSALHEAYNLIEQGVRGLREVSDAITGSGNTELHRHGDYGEHPRNQIH